MYNVVLNKTITSSVYKKLFVSVNEPCKLHCVADTPSYVFTIKHTATNGMSCSEEENNICVDGTCRVCVSLVRPFYLYAYYVRN